MKRRAFVLSGSLGLASLAFGTGWQDKLEPTITVFKDATCSCCNGWIEHLKTNGFQVVPQEVKNSELRELNVS